jgi:hypothetical protein
VLKKVMMEAMTKEHGGHAAGSKRRQPPTHLHKAVHRLLLSRKGRDGRCSALDQRLPVLWAASTLVLAGQLSLSFVTLMATPSPSLWGKENRGLYKRRGSYLREGRSQLLPGEPLARIDI